MTRLDYRMEGFSFDPRSEGFNHCLDHILSVLAFTRGFGRKTQHTYIIGLSLVDSSLFKHDVSCCDEGCDEHRSRYAHTMAILHDVVTGLLKSFWQYFEFEGLISTRQIMKDRTEVLKCRLVYTIEHDGVTRVTRPGGFNGNCGPCAE